MQRDGRTIDHGTLETIRLMAVEQEGEAAPIGTHTLLGIVQAGRFLLSKLAGGNAGGREARGSAKRQTDGTDGIANADDGSAVVGVCCDGFIDCDVWVEGGESLASPP
jgi:hypothetical protein